MIQCKFCGVSIFKQDDHGLRTCLSLEQIEARASHDHEQKVREQVQAELNKAAISIAQWLNLIGGKTARDQCAVILAAAVTLGLIEGDGKS